MQKESKYKVTPSNWTFSREGAVGLAVSVFCAAMAQMAPTLMPLWYVLAAVSLFFIVDSLLSWVKWKTSMDGRLQRSGLVIHESYAVSIEPSVFQRTCIAIFTVMLFGGLWIYNYRADRVSVKPSTSITASMIPLSSESKKTYRGPKSDMIKGKRILTAEDKTTLDTYIARTRDSLIGVVYAKSIAADDQILDDIADYIVRHGGRLSGLRKVSAHDGDLGIGNTTEHTVHGGENLYIGRRVGKTSPSINHRSSAESLAVEIFSFLRIQEKSCPQWNNVDCRTRVATLFQTLYGERVKRVIGQLESNGIIDLHQIDKICETTDSPEWVKECASFIKNGGKDLPGP